MRSISQFCKENKISLWIKETCLTIDHEGLSDFLPCMNYLTSYLICQLRDAHFVTPKNTEAAVVFILRSKCGIVNCINNSVPLYALDHVVLSLPESKEFMLLRRVLKILHTFLSSGPITHDQILSC
jgi:hypothetical protein